MLLLPIPLYEIKSMEMYTLVKYCAYVTVLEIISIAYMGSRLFYRYLVVTKIAWSYPSYPGANK